MASKIPLRKCAGCQELRDKRKLIRVVKTKENEIFLDLTGRENGRGAYICSSSDCLERAIKSKGLERSFRDKIPNEVYDKLREELKKNHG